MSETNAKPPSPKVGAFSWNELVSSDAAASGAFYSQLFGWTTAAFGPPNSETGLPQYQLFQSPASPMGVGGLMQAPHAGMPTHWVAYVVVANADESLAKAVSLGAKACVPVMAIPNVGRIAVIIDPLGAVLGLHELPKEPVEGCN